MSIDRELIRQRLQRGEGTDTIAAGDRATHQAALEEQARLEGELGTLPADPKTVAALRDERQLRWEAIAVRLYGSVRSVSTVRALYDEARGEGAHRRSYTGRGRRFPGMDERLRSQSSRPTSEGVRFGVVGRTPVSGERRREMDVLTEGSIADVRSYLIGHLHSDRFYLDGDRIYLELPDAPTTGEASARLTWFLNPSSYAAVRSHDQDEVHALPQGWDATLCGGPLASELRDAVTEVEEQVSCRECRLRLIAAELATDEAPSQALVGGLDEIREFKDDEEGYEAWLRDPANEYVLQVRRPRPPALPYGSYTLHHKDCPVLHPGGRKTSNAKRCGTRAALTAWTRTQIDEDPSLCTRCWS